jgi:hypothetical protein
MLYEENNSIFGPIRISLHKPERGFQTIAMELESVKSAKFPLITHGFFSWLSQSAKHELIH